MTEGCLNIFQQAHLRRNSPTSSM